MAQPGNFTPILLYASSTPTNVPSAGNLTNSATGSEIAINIADKNLFFKDSTNAINTVPIRQSSTSSNGWLSATDWNTFNNKAPATSGTSILYGNGTGGFNNVTIGTGVSFVGGTLSATGSGGTVTSVTGTSPVVSSGGTTPAISLATAYGDTLNPYASKTANYILAAPNGSAGVPTFRALVVADVTGLGTMATQNANAVAITGGTINGTTIGATTATTGAFTTVTASTSVTTPTVQASNSGGLALKNLGGTTQMSVGAGGGDNMSINVSTNLNGTNAQIDISPTGTGHVHIKPSGTGAVEIAPTNAGTINNMVIGGTTPLAITGTTITATTFSGSGASLTSIPNSALVNSTISGVALGGSLFNLTAGTGVSFSAGTTYNGSTAITINATGTGGTVTSVAQSFTGGLISVTGSPITTSGTLALTVAGTSGGIPYFSSATTWATSAALAANALVIGGGAGVAPATTTTGTGVVTALGVNIGTAGAFVVNGGALGTPSSGTVTNLTGTASININGTVGATTATTGAFTTVSATGVITSTLATGTAPFTVASTTQVANLNAATAGTAAALSATLVATSGGTGQSTYAVGDLLQGGATNTLTKLAAVATGNALISGGVTTASSWGKIGLTTHVSGTLPVANGGTNLASFTANGIMYASSTSALATGSALTFDGTNFATTGKASAGAFTATASTNPVNGMNLYGANNLGLYTNSTLSLFINATQQVGIGTNQPQVLLDVGPVTVSGLATYGGLIRITGYNTAATAAQGLEFQGRGDVAGFGNRISHRSNNGDLVFEGRANSATWTELVRMFPSGGVSIGNTTDPGATNLSVTGTIASASTVKTGGYTVATLPAAGTAGRRAYVTNALTPTYGSAVVGGGAVVIPVFDNGTIWIVA
jgi:hypothetical protein